MTRNLQEFVARLRLEKELAIVDAPVNPDLELAEIHRRVISAGGPALLFTQVRGSAFPVVSNLYGTRRRIEMAFGSRPENLIRRAAAAVDQILPLRLPMLWRERHLLQSLAGCGLKKISARRAPVLEKQAPADLGRLPVITSWQEDGGAFITQPLVYTEDPRTGQHNLGMYRMQVFSPDQTGMHWQIQKGGGFHYHQAEELQQPLPVHVYLGGPPALTCAAIAPLPEKVPELILASLLLGEKLPIARKAGFSYPVVAETDFLLAGEVLPGVRRQEGPFGDHYGYYSLAHDFPVFNLRSIHHRRDAIFPVTVVGKPRQEDYYIGDYLQSLLSPLFPLAMPGVRDLWTYGEAGFHALAAARVRESYHREALVSACRILGEGQLSLTKFLMVTDFPADLKSFSAVLSGILRRFDPGRDLLIIHDTSMDTLDYTGRIFNHGSKAVMLGVGEPSREIGTVYTGGPIPLVEKLDVYCPGCLMVSGSTYRDDPRLGEKVIEMGGSQLRDWPLLILVDDNAAIGNQTDFLWTVFTRFDPAHDLHGCRRIEGNKMVFQGPLLIDARMKPGYPDELIVRPDVADLVDRRWREYFPK